VSRFVDAGVPETLECRAEEHLRDTADTSLGRVDLRFDGPGGFTLFVENKLYSGYGEEQVNRYLRALKRLPPEGRSALIAVTRTVPTYGEPRLDIDNRWLGSVRWARMAEPLRALLIDDPSLRSQWRLFIDILIQQGDLGMTAVDADLIRAWARYRDGRAHLADLLDQVWSRAEDYLRRELAAKYGASGKAEELAAVHRHGAKRQLVGQRDQTRVFVGYSVPAIVKDQAVQVQFDGRYGVPHFAVRVTPWDAAARLDRNDAQLTGASDELKRQGFTTNGSEWARVHEPDEYLEAPDVPARLMTLIEDDFRVIVASDILKYDLDVGLGKARGGPPRHRRLPTSG
jgi:hypothetical protein